MKKLVSIFLALVLTLALSVSVFAADANITIGTDNTRNYVGYQLMTLTTSLKCSDTTHTHADTCYNYAYTINSVYSNILKDVTGQTSDDAVMTYLENNKTMIQSIADDIYRAIKANGTINGTEIKGNTATSLAQGYWLFADVTNLNGETDKANSVVMLKTHGQNNITVTPKVGLPSVTKEVKDVNDTNPNDNTTNGWGKSADRDIGDYVDFRLTATVHERLSSYNTYKLIFHDDLGTGFALDDTAKATIAVKAYTNATKTAELTITKDVDYVINYTTTDAGCDFEVVFNNIKTIANITNDVVFEVTYQAKLTEAAAVRNLNEVTLEFSNDPYNPASTGTTSNSVAVYTYKLAIDKKAERENGDALQGAGFTLFKMVDGEEVPVGTEIYGDGTMTHFEWNGLDDGTYVLKETKIPAGYNKMADLTFIVGATHDFDSVITLTAGDMDTTPATGLIEDIIVNNSGTVLPETGAQGTMWIIFGGAMLVILAGVFMITRKKMSIYED